MTESGKSGLGTSVQSVTAKLIVDKFPDLISFHSGNIDATVHFPASASAPKAESIIFVNDPTQLEATLKSPATIVVAPLKSKDVLTEWASKNSKSKTLLLSPNVKLSMALTNQNFFPHVFMREPLSVSGIHPAAQIAKSAQLGKNVFVGPGAVISNNCIIGDNTRIGANSVIEPNTHTGADCEIHPLVFIGHSCKIGARVQIKPHSSIGTDGFGYAQDAKGNHHKVPHYGALIIEDDVHIGANVNIDRGTFEPTIIRSGTKMDNHIHIAHNNELGRNCLVTAGFISAGSTKIGDNCVFAGRASMNGHITIANNITVGPLCAVIGDIPEDGGVYGGFPAIPMNESKRVQVSLRYVPQMRKHISKIMKHLGLEDDKS